MKARLILCGLALAAANCAFAGYQPVAISSSSYNADVIVEQSARPRLVVVTSATIDNGTNNTGNTLFEQGYDTNNPSNGAPPAGSTITSLDNANYSFTMAPSYSVPNGILVSAESPGGTFTFKTPAAYGVLSFLGLGGNGGDTFTVTVHHQDGTSETGTGSTSDWFGGTVGIAYIMGGRLNNVCNLTTETDGASGDGKGNPRLYHREVVLKNTTSPVTSVDLTYVSGSSGAHSDVMAVSGGTTTNGVQPIAVTGYNQDFICEVGAAHDNRLVSTTMENGTNIWATTQSMDNEGNTATSWYEQGYNLNNLNAGNGNGFGSNPENIDLTGTGLPHPGSFITNSSGDHIYQMPASYTTNDAVYISDAMTNATITLTTPAAFSGLSFLGSAGNGPVPVQIVVNHTGGKSETNVLTVGDWFNNAGPVIFIANGRVAVDSGQFSAVDGTDPVVLQNDLVLQDTTDPVTSITLNNTNYAAGTGRFSLFAVSGNVGALPPIFSVEPQSTNQYFGATVTLSGTATANAPITYQWQKGTNGVFANLANGGDYSGVTTGNLTISGLTFADQAQFRLVATDSGGIADSAIAQVGVFSSNVDVTQPGDTITGVNISPFGDGSPSYAIDNSMDTKFGANISGGVAGLVVSPSVGRTILNGLRIYTGADSTGRDPTSFALFGSLDGGNTYSLINSNAINLSNNRNPLVQEPPDPLTQYVTEVDFSNTAGYTTYKILFPTEKGTGQIQFQEMELLGVKDNAAPFFSTEPTDAKVFNGSSASFTATATFTNTVTIKWYQDNTNTGALTPLTDGGKISGSQTPTLTINPATFSDQGAFVAVANSSGGAITSSVVHLYVYSTLTDVTDQGATAEGFGDSTGTRYGNPDSAANLIDNSFTPWQNGGSGPSAGAGFAPFQETNLSGQYVPVGAFITLSTGPAIVTGLRVYPGQDAADNDPSYYVLEGSTGDTNGPWTVISQGPLNLPLDRTSLGNSIDPTQNPVQEVLFNNSQGYATYQIVFPSDRNPNGSAYLEVGEIELLGVYGSGVPTPHISGITLSGGSIHISASGGAANGTYSVLTNGTLNIPSSQWHTNTTGTFDASGDLNVSMPVNTNIPSMFYVIKTP